MNVISILLTAMAVVALVLYLKLEKKKRELAELRIKLQIAKEKLVLWQHFVNNASIKDFFKVIDNVSAEAFDSDIQRMLVKYFNKIFLTIDFSQLPSLIDDIRSIKKHTKIVINALAQAHTNYNLHLAGVALAAATEACDQHQLQAINEFIRLLNDDARKEQIKIAIVFIKKFLGSGGADQLPNERRVEIEAALKKLEEERERLG